MLLWSSKQQIKKYDNLVLSIQKYSIKTTNANNMAEK